MHTKHLLLIAAAGLLVTTLEAQAQAGPKLGPAQPATTAAKTSTSASSDALSRSKVQGASTTPTSATASTVVAAKASTSAAAPEFKSKTPPTQK